MLYKDANGKEIEVVYNSKTNSFTPAAPIGGTFIKVLNEKVLETAYQLPIHDWGSIYSSYGNDISDSIMDSKGITMLVPAVYVNEIHENAPEQINRIYNTWKSTNHSFYALSSSGPADITAFIEKYKVPFQFGQADNKLLMSMIRSNPGVILIKDGVVIKRWCFRNLPSDKELLKYAQ